MQKKTHSAEFKAKLVIEVLKELKMINQIASENGINPNLLSRWKTEAVKNLSKVFSKDTAEMDKLKKGYETKIEELYTQIGKLSTELDWLKKKCGI